MKPPTLSSSFLLLTGILLSCLTETVLSSQNVEFASPLQSFTLWDDRHGSGEASPRAKFLPRYKAGLEAEFKTEELIQAKFQEALDKLDPRDRLWSRKAALLDARRVARLDAATSAAYEKAMAKYEASIEKQEKNKQKNKKRGRDAAVDDDNKYQFVGVVSKDGPMERPVQWYARKKPKGANWSLRIVHVNKDAIVKDLYDRGRLDIEAKYKNVGDGKVTATYEAKERSWKTLWNFSPIGFFTDSSGQFWRERRLQEGVFTDGEDVYESRYRYRDGRNGMYRTKESLAEYMENHNFTKTKAEAALKKVKEGKPDVVVECPARHTVPGEDDLD